MNKKVKIFILAGLALVSIFALSTSKVSANPLFFPPSISTSAATTTVAYIGTGTGTSTVTYDAYVPGAAKAIDRAAVVVQFAASSTSSVLGINIQYSQDGIDWYSDMINSPATSTPANLANPFSYTWKAISTATSSVAFIVQTPTRYMRVVSSLTGAAGAVWESILPERQSN